MAVKKALSEDEKFPLIIDVQKTFPLRRIKTIYIKNPSFDYRDDITITREQAVYLRDSLNDILDGKPKEEKEQK